MGSRGGHRGGGLRRRTRSLVRFSLMFCMRQEWGLVFWTGAPNDRRVVCAIGDLCVVWLLDHTPCSRKEGGAQSGVCFRLSPRSLTTFLLVWFWSSLQKNCLFVE